MSHKQYQTKQPLYQVLSLDVVLGSIAVGIFAINLLSVKPNPAWFFILAGAVWVVYTLDHLLDGLKHKGKSHIYRHWFHYKHRKAIISAMLAVSLFTIGLAFTFLDRNILVWGIYLSLFVMGYFALHYLSGKRNKSYFQKELIIAAVYIGGIFLAPLAWYGGLPDNDLLMIIAILFLLVWIESITISYYDYDLDRADKLDSFTIAYGKKGSRTFVIILLSSIIILLVFWLLAGQDGLIRVAVWIELVMGTLLLMLLLYPNYFGRYGVFRWIGEGVFLLPAFIIII